MQITSATGSPAFEAVLYPNQPPNGKAFAIVLGVVALVLAVFALGFVIAGAWPVTGFLGIDVILLVVAFRWVRREARRREHIRLDRAGLHVQCVEPGGSRRSWRFEPCRVRVGIDEPPGPGSLLTLAEPGCTLTLGRFLTPDERLDLARALRRALNAQSD